MAKLRLSQQRQRSELERQRGAWWRPPAAADAAQDLLLRRSGDFLRTGGGPERRSGGGPGGRCQVPPESLRLRRRQQQQQQTCHTAVGPGLVSQVTRAALLDPAISRRGCTVCPAPVIPVSAVGSRLAALLMFTYRRLVCLSGGRPLAVCLQTDAEQTVLLGARPDSDSVTARRGTRGRVCSGRAVRTSSDSSAQMASQSIATDRREETRRGFRDEVRRGFRDEVRRGFRDEARRVCRCRLSEGVAGVLLRKAAVCWSGVVCF